MSERKRFLELADRLSPAHWEALRRLAASTGREFPMDSSLYRDLIKLELIVDRGNTVQLSKLGEELLLQYPLELEAQH